MTAGLRLPEVLVDQWLKRHGITREQINLGAPVWETSGGKVALTFADVERMIGIEDPVSWAWLNLIERRTLTIDGVVAVEAGMPWALFPIQAELARTHGDLIVECGSEVGKTRDVVLRRLWSVDTKPNSSSMIGGDSDQTLIPIWEEIEFQLEQNPRIAGGLVEEKCHIKPNRKKVFKNGSEIELRLAGHDGKNFRGGHFTDGIDADESAMWKNPRQWSEFFRSGLPGSVARIYSTPDGDYSSPYYAMCASAVPINGPKAEEYQKKNIASVDTAGRRFLKFHISKKQLPPPFWSKQRADGFRVQFGGEDTVGWITNVEGGWGSPTYSVFPMPLLRPNLRFLSHYRIVVVSIDREHAEFTLTAARLGAADESGAASDEILDRTTEPMASGKDLGRSIAAWFPDLRDWKDPKLYCGADLGSAQDPSEFVFARVAGETWTDVFRLHLRSADWPIQTAVVMALDHASGHRVIYSMDNGSAGAALIQGLTQVESSRVCPTCAGAVYLAERLRGRGFGESIDDFDFRTGEPVWNPNDRDASGNPRPYRVSVKEFGTRVLERKMASIELEIALDGGAGDQRLSGPQLMVNHTSSGTNKRGERNFRGKDDHHVDARRQLALAIVSERVTDGFVSPDRSLMLQSGDKRFQVFADAGPVAAAFSIPRLGRRVFD